MSIMLLEKFVLPTSSSKTKNNVGLQIGNYFSGVLCPIPDVHELGNDALLPRHLLNIRGSERGLRDGAIPTRQVVVMRRRGKGENVLILSVQLGHRDARPRICTRARALSESST